MVLTRVLVEGRGMLAIEGARSKYPMVEATIRLAKPQMPFPTRSAFLRAVTTGSSSEVQYLPNM